MASAIPSADFSNAAHAVFAYALPDIVERAASIIDIPYQDEAHRRELRAHEREHYIFYREFAEEPTHNEDLNKPLKGIFILSNFSTRFSHDQQKEITIRNDTAVFVSLRAENGEGDYAGLYDGTRNEGMICFEDTYGKSIRVPPLALAEGSLFSIASAKAGGETIRSGDCLLIESEPGKLLAPWSGKADVIIERIISEEEIIASQATDPRPSLFEWRELFGVNQPRRPQVSPQNEREFFYAI